MADEMVKQCAAKLLETCRWVVRTTKAEIGKRSSAALSVRETVAMMMIGEKNSASLSAISEHLGCTLSGASRMIDGLVDQGYIARATAEHDRRQLTLTLTADGRHALEQASAEEMSYMVDMLSSLTPTECSMVNLVMDLLRRNITDSRL
ncbi:MAG: MarR family transcriptional regulator [Armatimonadota bacterium]|nr:MarR family transcriptional regulator [bacterium]